EEEKVDLLVRAEILATLGELTRDYEESLRMIRDAIRADSNYHQLYFLLGHYLEETAMEPPAIVAYKKCLMKNPGNHWAMLKLAKLYMAPRDPSLRDADSALAFARRACEATYYRKAYPLQNLARALSE